MKKTIIIALASVIVLAGVAIVTCPDKQDHKDAIMAVVNEKINDSMGVSSSPEEDGIALIFSSIGSGIVGRLIDNRLNVRNNFVFSVGEIQLTDGRTERLSVGVFGHVFTMSKEDLDKALDGII